MKVLNWSRMKSYLFMGSIALNVLIVGALAYVVVSLFPPHQPSIDSSSISKPISYPAEATMPIEVLNQLAEQQLISGASPGTKAAHLSGITFRFNGSDLVTNARIFLFGKTLNLEVTSYIVLLNGDVRLDVKSANVSGFPLAVDMLFSILSAVNFPDWVRVDKSQQQVWIQVTGHRFSNYAVFVKDIDSFHDKITLGVSVVPGPPQK